ncbi:MAG: TRAP transporter large permease subunit [Saprospiraceae bacterium]|nr:TRAP transporter large permease subunit [Saprospiraceae bacterium]
MEFLAIILFILIFLLLLKGYPVAFTLGGASVLFGLGVSYWAPEYFHLSDFKLLAPRIMGTMKNYVLIAVPLFIYMGIMLQKSGLAESLLETMAMLFGKVKGGLAISVVVVGALLAASTGIVGATVVTMGLISLPTMIKRGYNVELASGTIAASGTLGQIIPPSIVLVLLADTINNSSRGGSNVDVGTMFTAALLPGLLLVLCYMAYIMIKAYSGENMAPPIPEEEIEEFKGKGFFWRVLKVFILPMILIVAVLGSIFAGLASPTEAAAVGALGATVLTVIQKKFSYSVLKEVMEETTHLTTMVFMILLGATTFTLVFKMLGGDDFLIRYITESDLSPSVFILLVMIVIFVTGFFVDFIEIIFILVPVVTPLFNALEIDMLWIGVLIALNLQTSFLTPPFGFSLFYLKGVSPEGVRTQQIYRGAVPYIVIQILFLFAIFMFPELVYFFL